jgi:dienelactone hydrolase
MSHRRVFARIFFVLAAFGAVSALAMLGRASLTSVHAVDVVHLIGTGMCFGGAVVALALYFRESP